MIHLASSILALTAWSVSIGGACALFASRPAPRWVEGARERLERAHADAIRTLIETAAVAGVGMTILAVDDDAYRGLAFMIRTSAVVPLLQIGSSGLIALEPRSWAAALGATIRLARGGLVLAWIASVTWHLLGAF